MPPLERGDRARGRERNTRVTRVTVGDKDKGVGVIEIRMIASDKKILRACLADIHYCKSESGFGIRRGSVPPWI
jgi:hypothetical protein